MQALSRDYEVVLNMDLEADTVTMYSCSEKMANVVDDESLRKPFYEAGEQFYRAMVCDEDLPELLELTTREKIGEYLRNDTIFSHIFRDKQGRYAESRIVPINDHEFVCGYTDVDNVIREKMKQQEKLEKAMREAEAASKAKSAFLLNMSHDIRTPMNAIIGYTDILAKYRQDEKEFERCTDNIRASGKYLLDLINNVLEMARIESGVEEIKEEPCDIRTILGSTYIVFKEEADKKGITLTYDRHIRHNFLYCDRVRLQELHLNILSNAVKYTMTGGITIKAVPGEVSITDTGIGIAPEDVPRIFEKGYTGFNGRSGRKSSGLGLYLCSLAAKKLSLELSVDSEPGVGSTFRIKYVPDNASQIFND
jgi:signal transduction histidine kinase